MTVAAMESTMRITSSTRLALAAEVYRHYREVIEHSADLDLDEAPRISADLVYLLGAIVTGGICEWPENRPLVQLLQLQFRREAGAAGERHPVWTFLKLTPAECCGGEVEMVECKFCHGAIVQTLGHRHGQGWVGECCWDERLRSTE